MVTGGFEPLGVEEPNAEPVSFGSPTPTPGLAAPAGPTVSPFADTPQRLPLNSEAFLPLEKPDKSSFDFGDILDFDDLFLFAPRGVEGLVRSIGDLSNFIPGVDVNFSAGDRIFGRSDSIVGALAEGFTQFLIPFGVASKSLAIAGTAIRGATLGARTATAATTATRIGTFATTNRIAASAVSGAIADSVAFSAREERLSNFLVRVPFLKNSVTEYLSASPEDSEAEGRFKNVLEGLVLGGLTDVLLGAVRGVRASRQAVEDGATLGDALKAGDAVGPDPTATSDALRALAEDPDILSEAAVRSTDTLKQAC